MDDIVSKSRSIISENRYLTLATSGNNKPWVAGLAYAVDKNYNFYFYSAKNSRHGEHIAQNPNVAFSIFNSTSPSEEVDGLQIEGVASLIEILELPKVMALYYEQSFPDEALRKMWSQPIEAFRDIAIKRFYKLQPLHIYKLDLSTIEVDIRVEIDLNELKKIPAK